MVTSESEHSHDFTKPEWNEKVVLVASSAFAWTAFPAAVIVYLVHFSGSLVLGHRWFDLVEVWLLALAAVAMKVASLRADDTVVEDAWHEGLRLGLARTARCSAAKARVRFLARPVVWQACGYLACASWTAAAIATYLVAYRVVHPGDGELVLGMMLLLVLAVHGTTVRLIGPGLTRVRTAYDAGCEAQQSLRAHSEVYECLQELDALEILGLVRSLPVLEVALAVNALLEKRRAADQRPHLSLVEDDDPDDRGETGRSRPA